VVFSSPQREDSLERKPEQTSPSLNPKSKLTVVMQVV
jgi:hypothetical protein